MAKTMPAEGGGGSVDRADWEADDYIVALKKAEPVENRYYEDVAALQKRYGEPEGHNAHGTPFWIVEGKKKYPDFPEDRTQWKLIFEVLEGDKAGDWLFVYASPRFWPKSDGTWGGKLAAIYLAADPAFPLHEGIEDDLSDLLGIPLRVGVEPKAGDAKFAIVKQWLKLKSDADRAKYAKLGAAIVTDGHAARPAAEQAAPAAPSPDDDEIPF